MNEVHCEPFYLPNIPVYKAKLPKDIVDDLWKYIDTAVERYANDNKSNLYNYRLAGNVDKSLELIDEENKFFNFVVGPMCGRYLDAQTKKPNGEREISNFVYSTTSASLNCIKLHDLWVNFQNKHEFNPLHDHAGIISFVIWMKIPTDYEDQYKIPIAKNSTAKSISNFAFAYTDILGHIQEYSIQMSSSQNAWMMLFPSSLKHQVYPFYQSDEQRVSISGNVVFDEV
tara:strand:- start:319 stop:1002 length:684 start_codon:yes stop_codon:yes gene_type:complete